MKHLTIAEVAERLGTSEKAIRQRIFRGQFPYRRMGSRILIDEQELKEFLQKLPGCSVDEALREVNHGQC